jgi:L-Ala-D/L-Glu epimerase
MNALHSILATLERWPLRAPFSISRYTFFDSLVATVELSDDAGHIGRGEGEPHEWDGDAAERLLAASDIAVAKRASPGWLAGLTRANLTERLPRSPLRNAVDCALWDLEAKAASTRAWCAAGFPGAPVPVMPTIGIDSPAAMEESARSFRGTRWIKVKLGSRDGLDEQRLEAVAGAAPDAVLLLDANGGWTPADLTRLLPLAARLSVRMIEQPVRPGLDDCMPRTVGDILFCADESCLDRESLPMVRQHYQYINIKLDKAGGLTEALALRCAAEHAGLGVMVGMMSGTSLAVAPAFVLAQGLEVVDLELGFMTSDRNPPMVIRDNALHPPETALWG